MVPVVTSVFAVATSVFTFAAVLTTVAVLLTTITSLEETLVTPLGDLFADLRAVHIRLAEVDP